MGHRSQPRCQLTSKRVNLALFVAKFLFPSQEGSYILTVSNMTRKKKLKSRAPVSPKAAKRTGTRWQQLGPELEMGQCQRARASRPRKHRQQFGRSGSPVVITFHCIVIDKCLFSVPSRYDSGQMKAGHARMTGLPSCTDEARCGGGGAGCPGSRGLSLAPWVPDSACQGLRWWPPGDKRVVIKHTVL